MSSLECQGTRRRWILRVFVRNFNDNRPVHINLAAMNPEILNKLNDSLHLFVVSGKRELSDRDQALIKFVNVRSTLNTGNDVIVLQRQQIITSPGILDLKCAPLTSSLIRRNTKSR